MPPGKYYYSVQAVDASYTGSTFSDRKAFTLSASGETKELTPPSDILFNDSTSSSYYFRKGDSANFKVVLKAISKDLTAKYKVSLEAGSSSIFNLDVATNTVTVTASFATSASHAVTASYVNSSQANQINGIRYSASLATPNTLFSFIAGFSTTGAGPTTASINIPQLGGKTLGTSAFVTANASGSVNSISVNSLAGNYITAEDVGVSPIDMTHVNKETNHVVGLPGKSGDPSPVTAYGIYQGMKAAAKEAFGDDYDEQGQSSYEQDQLRQAIGDEAFAQIQEFVDQGADPMALPDELYNVLYDHYQDEMPYGTQKARDGDPFEWISEKLMSVFGDETLPFEPDETSNFTAIQNNINSYYSIY